MSNRDRDRIELLGPYANAPTWRWPGEPDSEKFSIYANWSFENMAEKVNRALPNWEPVAKVHLGGVLVRHRATGQIREFCGNYLVGVNDRKARAALASLNGAAAGKKP